MVLTIVETAHRLLRLGPTDIARLWDWTPLFSLFKKGVNEKVQWHAFQIVSMVLGLVDDAKIKALSNVKEMKFSEASHLKYSKFVQQ